MDTRELTAERVVEAVHAFAAGRMNEGASSQDIEGELVEKGLDQSAAETVVQNLTTARSEALREAGAKNMLFGALWCIGGIVVTAWAYHEAATAAGGGTYVIAWGAIVFGAIQFFRGLIQLTDE